MQFLDTNVLAYAFYENEHKEACRNAIRNGGIINTFNLIEAFHIIEKETNSREIAYRAIKGLLKSSLKIIEVDNNLIFETLKRIEKTKLSIFDAVHYTCALMNNCELMISYDDGFDAVIEREEPEEDMAWKDL